MEAVGKWVKQAVALVWADWDCDWAELEKLDEVDYELLYGGAA